MCMKRKCYWVSFSPRYLCLRPFILMSGGASVERVTKEQLLKNIGIVSLTAKDSSRLSSRYPAFIEIRWFFFLSGLRIDRQTDRRGDDRTNRVRRGVDSHKGFMGNKNSSQFISRFWLIVGLPRRRIINPGRQRRELKHSLHSRIAAFLTEKTELYRPAVENVYWIITTNYMCSLAWGKD